MILVGYSWIDVLLGILYVSLGLLVLVILYRRLLSFLGRGNLVNANYCELYAQENDPVSGEVTFYFTASKEVDFKLLLLDKDLNEKLCIAEKIGTAGGNIIRFDSTSVQNGSYFYSLVTNNQRSMKKMTVSNP